MVVAGGWENKRKRAKENSTNACPYKVLFAMGNHPVLPFLLCKRASRLGELSCPRKRQRCEPGPALSHSEDHFLSPVSIAKVGCYRI